jgi:hypothetical protein
MTWTAICVNLDGEVSFTFSFTGSHSQSAAFAHAQNQTSFEVIAIIPGDHSVYHPDTDE